MGKYGGRLMKTFLLSLKVGEVGREFFAFKDCGGTERFPNPVESGDEILFT
jgi:hypothetical protein